MVALDKKPSFSGLPGARCGIPDGDTCASSTPEGQTEPQSPSSRGDALTGTFIPRKILQVLCCRSSGIFLEEEPLAALPPVTPILCEVLSCLFEPVPALASADSSSNELPAHVLAGKALSFAPASAACSFCLELLLPAGL